jgi:small-conductance mechanosensitive channel
MDWPAVQDMLNRELFAAGETKFTVASLVLLVLLPILVILFAKMLRSLLLRVLSRTKALDPGTQNTIASLAYYLTLVIGMIWAVSVSGLNTSSLAVFSGGLGVGVGLGLQDIAKNFISGLIMLMTKTVKPGDVITVEELTGRVHQIGSYSTTLKTVQDAIVIVPNSQILDKQFINWTHNRRLRMLEIPIGVHYDSDLDLVIQCLKDAAASNEWILDSPDPQIVLTEFADSSVNFLARVWTKEVMYSVKVISAYNLEVARLFQERKVIIPYPQRDVYVRHLNGPDSS